MPSNKSLSPPVANKIPSKSSVHNHERTDNYAWIRDKESSEVKAYLDAENAYTQSEMAHTASLQTTLYDEMLGHIEENDASTPVKVGDYFYYHRIDEGKQYWAHYRKHLTLDAPEELLLDENELAESGGHDYFELGALEISPNHKRLTYSTDTTGAEAYTIYTKDLATGELFAEKITNNAGCVSWGDNDTLFYTTEEDETKRSDKLFRHTLGTSQADDVLVFHDKDGLFNVSAALSKDEQYLFVSTGSIETTEQHFIATNDIEQAPTVIQSRTDGLRYSVEHHNGLFYIVTNADDAINQKLVTCPVATPSREHWETMIAHRDDVQLEHVELFNEFLVSLERSEGLYHMKVIKLSDQSSHMISLPEAIYSAGPAANPEFNTSTLRFVYTSLVTPMSTFDYDMETRERVLKKQKVVPNYDASLYTSERIFATADDGTQIPISLVYKKDAWNGEATYCHLYGYGSYGHTIEPDFSTTRLSLLDRGMVYAIAHVRGEEIYGRSWYEDGKFLNKKNTFTDFISCAKHLIEKNYTKPEKMSMEGRSAGGLLMGAVLNMAPELFHVALAGVPFVDVVNTMLDESIPLTTGEFEEWGNPMDEEYYHYMLSYSPYDNVTAQCYPATLVTAGLNDPRVQYWEPAKWVAKLRDLKTDNNALYLHMHMSAGHFASSGRYAYLKDLAFDYAFVLDQLGIGDNN
ncbi:S9 family peptidase [Leucothrix arctica]|uniref:Oligopeptidase B n=1 Tax=Leucothrix arctica TaxID=1481894 RepID=A0A317CPJ0_9GAMM|nr:S9 family peptidase [Leucothrix arctica]PWQ98290.1 oligopeptidase B [Leucothrix arctica]